MRPVVLLLAALILALPAAAETVVAARTLRAQTVIGPDDVTLSDDAAPGVAGVAGGGGYTSLDEVIGTEARVALYAGRPIRPGDVGPPALVARNQIVPLIYTAGGLVITAEGRALGRAGLGETVRVMNLASRQTVSGRVQSDGSITVGPTAAPLTH